MKIKRRQLSSIFISVLLISITLSIAEPVKDSKITSSVAEFNKNSTISYHEKHMEEVYNVKSNAIDCMNSADTEKVHVPIPNTINDIIDQQQTEHCGHGIAIYNETWYAQSYKPSLGILTRIQLFLFREGNPSDSIEITVSIKESLYRRDLASDSVNGSQISQQGGWVEFDFFYIGISPGNTYYIICMTNGGSANDHFSWYFDINNPYGGGDAQYSEDHGHSWYLLDDPPEFPEKDFCFKTYGEANSRPNKPIKPDGETKGYYDKPYNYSTSTIDADDDELFYFWDWGDGNDSGWIGPYYSGEICNAMHTWMIKGSYLVRVKVKDSWGIESDWSDSLTVRMEKRKSDYLLCSFVLQKFGEKVPLIRKIVSHYQTNNISILW